MRRHEGMTFHSLSQGLLRNTFSYIFENGIYKFNCANESPFIIDGGANIGLATLYWKHIFPNAEVLAFEPSREVFKVLQKNVLENNLSSVTLVEKALYSSVTNLEFTSNEALSGSLVKEKSLQHNYKVETDILSKYLDRPVDLLKLDIEGAELEVLREAEHKLANVKRIFVEYHSFVHKKPELSEILAILERQGYRYHMSTDYHIPSPFLGFLDSLGQDFQINIWAVRP